jgi:site-specific recombinase
MKKKNSPPADRRWLPAMAFGRWISTTKIVKKNLATSLLSSCSNRFIRAVLVGIEIVIVMVNMAMVGQFYQIWGKCS